MQFARKKNESPRNNLALWLLMLFGSVLPAQTVIGQNAETKKQQSQEKKITYRCQNEKLSVALRQVERLSGWYKVQFAYDDVQTHTVSISLKDVGMEQAIGRLLAGTGLQYEINGRFIQIFSSKTTAQRQTKVVSGTVRDAEGNPLEGAGVYNKADNRGTITDMNGQFSLETSQDVATLTISYIGKQSLTCKAVKGKSLKVTLKDDETMMSDVVVTGYQNIDRRHLTSAVSSVKMEDIQIPGVTNLTQMLQGKIPDMVVTTNSGELNSTPRLRIRGTSTIIGNREPLWVVDGIIVNDPVDLSPDVLNDPDYVNRIGNAISGINPQDIERLDVLKDAAATALYGTRAANGVIVITTKKGRTGKPQISYSATGTFRRRPHYTDKKINLMNSKERIQFSQELVSMHYLYPQNMPMVGYENALQNLYNGTYTPEQFQSEVQKMQTMNTDWFDLLSHNSFSQDHNLNVSGGSDKIRYYASLGYTNENDVIINNTNRRYTANSKLDITLSSKFQLTFNMSGYLSEKKYPQINTIDYAYNTSRAIPAYNADGTYSFYKKNGTNNAGYLNYNVLNELDNSHQKQSTTGVTMTANLRYAATDWLSINGILSTSATNTDQEGYWGEKTFYAANLRKCDYGMIPTSESLMPYGGELSTTKSKNKSYTARLQANFNKSFGEDRMHTVAAVIGGEANSNRYEAYASTERGYFLDRGKKFMSDISSDFTAYNNWLRQNTPYITDTQTNLLSAYLTASYSFRDWFTVNANTRYDGSNKFGSRSNEKLLPVWSVSGMADLANIFHLQEKWKPVNSLVLKASYGEQGNMLDGQTSELVITKGSMNGYYNELFSKVSAFANPDLKWEKTRSMNVAVEGSFLNNRLMLGFEYYHKKTTDAFMSKQISDVNGYSSYIVNSGIVVNKGYNVNITAVPIRTNDFYWSLSGSLSKVMNRMETAPGMDTYELSDFLNGTAIVKGQPVGTFYSYKFIGLDPEDGGPMFDDGEDMKDELKSMGKYDTFTTVLTPSGRRDPDITGSLNSTFSWKSWRLNLGLYYSLGAKTRLFRVFKDFVSGYSTEMNINRDLLNAWKKPGDENNTNIPSVMGVSSPGYSKYYRHWSSAYNYAGVKFADNAWTMFDYSDARVVSANYLKIQNISLTYEVPQAWLQTYKLQRLAVTLGATNLHTFCSSKLRGQTPTQSGFSEVQLSDTPTWTLGLTVNF